MPTERTHRLRTAIVAVVAFGLVAALTWGAAELYFSLTRQPAPWSPSCTAAVNGESVRVEPEQARNAAIIAGVSVRRGLVPRAASIGLATAYQESGLRNLDYGDRDSLGLFQQRPSQGWGTEAQVQDPWYASNAFYAAMEKVKGWQTADIGDVAQAVQRSGFPDAYDKHVPNARLLASALTGETPASFTCTTRGAATADAPGLAAFLTKTLPKDAVVKTTASQVTVSLKSSQVAWATAHIAVAATDGYGVRSVTLGDRTWTASGPPGGGWTSTATPAPTAATNQVVIALA